MTFWGFMKSQDYFTPLSHGPHVDGTDEDIKNHLTICKHNMAFSQAARMGFDPAAQYQLIWICQPLILHSNVPLFLKIYV